MRKAGGDEVPWCQVYVFEAKDTKGISHSERGFRGISDTDGTVLYSKLFY